jgi:hypothetical protein
MKLDKKVSELEIARKKAYSLKGNSRGMNYVGAFEEKDGKVNMFWIDEDGTYWYKTYFRVQDKLVSEEEYIFGRKIIKPRRSWNSATK